MTDFDQLIKEKAESAQYEYKPSAWRKFAKSAGWRAGWSAWQVAAVAATVVALGTAVAYMWKHSSHSEMPEPVTPQVAVTTDTLQEETEEVASLPVAESSAPRKTVKTTPKVSEETPADEPKTAIEVAKPAKTKSSPTYGRPVILNFDTVRQLEPSDEELRTGNSRLFEN